MRYHIGIQFKKGPSFGTDVEAQTEKQARDWAINAAKRRGFTEQVKKVIVTRKDPEPITCLNCGEPHIRPGENEQAQMDSCRQRDLLDIQAEQAAWYENHWDTI